MHEATLCQQIINIINEYSKQEPFEQIVKVHLNVGKLAGVEIDAIRFCFPIIAKNTIAQNAELIIHEFAAQGLCSYCNKKSNMQHRFDVCEYCKKPGLNITTGLEFTVSHLECV